MASKNSHAAWQTERSFAVRVLTEQGKPTELAAGVGDYLEAVDLATEWLERTDPKRTGTTPIEIVESRDGGEATVWEYPPANRPPSSNISNSTNSHPSICCMNGVFSGSSAVSRFHPTSMNRTCRPSSRTES